MITIHDRLKTLREAIDAEKWEEASRTACDLWQAVDNMWENDKHLDKDAFDNWFDMIGEAK